MIEEKYMRRALQLARGGEGRVAPNPWWARWWSLMAG